MDNVPHSQNCPKGAGQWSLRHNSIRDSLTNLLRYLNLSVQSEQEAGLEHRPDLRVSSARDADSYLEVHVGHPKADNDHQWCRWASDTDQWTRQKWSERFVQQNTFSFVKIKPTKDNKTMADVFSVILGVVCILSAVFIIILVASFAWFCIRALAINDLVEEEHDKDMREPLVENIFAQNIKVDDTSAPIYNV